MDVSLIYGDYYFIEGLIRLNEANLTLALAPPVAAPRKTAAEKATRTTGGAKWNATEMRAKADVGAGAPVSLRRIRDVDRGFTAIAVSPGLGLSVGQRAMTDSARKRLARIEVIYLSAKMLYKTRTTATMIDWIGWAGWLYNQKQHRPSECRKRKGFQNVGEFSGENIDHVWSLGAPSGSRV